MADQSTLTAALASLRRQGHTLEASYTGLVGLVIAVLRREKGWSQNQLAKISGISQATISRIEVGEADITVPQIDAVCESLGFKASFMFDTADKLRDMLERESIDVAKRSGSDKNTPFNVGQTVAATGALLGGGPVGFLVGTILGTAVLSARKDRP
jgi:transcriptional regulator with XRE-family HTH domain